MNLLRKVALAIPQIRRLRHERAALMAEIGSLKAEQFGSPFYHYNASFDAQEIIRRYAVDRPATDPDHVTNFLGVRIPPKIFPETLEGKNGTVEPPPIPANWHADIAEWAAALRSVDLAKGEFRAVEVGCGWACWLSNMGAAARGRGLKVDLVGIEGDEEHVRWANETLHSNGFQPDEFRVVHGIASPRSGKALFPMAEDSGATWGSEPIFDASEGEMRKAEKIGNYKILDAVAIDDLVSDRQIDLLHIDIQGGEVDFLRENLPVINRLVRYLVIGTHSRQIEGALMAILREAGWTLEIERPAILSPLSNFTDGPVTASVDGVQGWRAP
jgi:hypothetical protein